MFFLVTICLIFIDLTSKWAFSTFLGTKSIAILGDYLMLHVVHNTGIAFSLPIEGILLKCITILLIGGIVVYYFWYEKYKNAFLVRISYALILAWAIANGMERIWYGRVIDFIVVKYFAIFNFADIFISIGACFLFFFYYSHERRTK